MKRATSIYVCCDPDTLEPRYVGKTVTSVKRRINGHLHDKSNNHSACWFRSVKNPIYFTLEIVPADKDWTKREQHWIKTIKSLGCNLTNATIGGEGALGNNPSSETRLKLSALLKGKPSRNKGKKSSPETIAKKSMALKGNKNALGHRWTQEQRQAMSIARKGKPNPYAVGNTYTRGRKLTEEHKAKVGKANKGRIRSDEVKAKISMSLMGNTNTLGYVHSDESKAKISQSLRAYYSGVQNVCAN